MLAPGGLLYFTVDFHHPVYAAAARLHSAWNDAELRFEFGPFADHTVHLTLPAARSLFEGLPLRVVEETRQRRRRAARGAAASPAPRRRPSDTALVQERPYEVVAGRTP